MSFQKVVCWAPAEAEQMMNTEALQPDRATFLAVHHPVRMTRTGNAGLSREGEGADYSERQLLEDLLAPPDFALVPVLGQAGSGKSHLVRWLSLKIENSPQRHVLLIKRIDTNLYDILEQILGLPGVADDPEFDDYRKSLRTSRQQLQSEAQARELLRNQLALNCGPNVSRSREPGEEEQYLIENLPNLLYDPHFGAVLQKEGGVLDRLVKHIIGRTSTAERREFEERIEASDLPLKATDVAKLAPQNRRFHGELVGLAEIAEAAVKWLNQNLSAAITSLMNFSGDSLPRLFRGVRAALARKDIELVLLIEDLQKCQGIERQLLDAIVEKPYQEDGQSLCRLRTVLACNRGYFDGLPDTVRTRANFFVTVSDLDQPGKAASPQEIEEFVARYLNAARIGESRLNESRHRAEKRGDDDDIDAVPNACAACDYREQCHKSFGERDGIGFYPFTPTAIARMSRRVAADGLRPRFLLNDMLKPVMWMYADDLRNGRFPPAALGEKFRGVTLPAHVKTDLTARELNPELRERRQVLLDLWTSGTSVKDVDPGIHEAFQLPPLGLPAATNRAADKALSPNRPNTREPSPDVQDDVDPRILAKLTELNDWANGKTMSQTLLREMRDEVRRVINSRIDWDAELLLPSRLSAIQEKRWPNFRRQSTQPSQSEVQLLIPSADSPDSRSTQERRRAIGRPVCRLGHALRRRCFAADLSGVGSRCRRDPAATQVIV